MNKAVIVDAIEKVTSETNKKEVRNESSLGQKEQELQMFPKSCESSGQRRGHEGIIASIKINQHLLEQLLLTKARLYLNVTIVQQTRWKRKWNIPHYKEGNPTISNKQHGWTEKT